MRYMGIDFGSKRVGVAISDEEGHLAFPHSVLAGGKDLLDEVVKIIEKENVEKIVIGESLNFQGEPNKIMVDIAKFKKELEDKTKKEVIFEPEFLTSVQAERFQKKNEMHDASAAAIILQSHLDIRSNELKTNGYE